MKHFTRSLLMALLPIGVLKAEPAVYVFEDAKLTIPDAVVIQYGRSSYFTNVKFEHTGNGVWRFAGGESSKLAHVADVEIVSEATVPPKVSVRLQGYKSLACVGLEAPAIARQHKTFHIVLAETAVPDNVRCVSSIEPYEISVELDVSGLTRGTYAVNANGVLSHFDILPP